MSRRGDHPSTGESTMRTRFPLRIALCLAVPFVFAMSSQASAGCLKTCSHEIKDCAAAARPTLLDCRLECRSSASDGGMADCMAGCRDVLTMTRSTCRTGRSSCIDACRAGVDDPSQNPPPDDPSDDPSDDNPGNSSGTNSASCMGQCGQTLGSCAHDVAAGGASCIKNCASAEDHGACVRGCTSAARETASGCKADARSCHEDCGFPSSSTTTLSGLPTTTLSGPTTTEPAATTTLPGATTTSTLPACENASAPTCGGTCLSSTAECREDSGNVCACFE